MYESIERPPRNRRKLTANDLDWDQEVEDALLTTIDTGQAVKIPLSVFHSSPAKGRLWKIGYAVRHRVLPDRLFVAAWLEEQNDFGTN